MIDMDLAKVGVEGSNPFARSSVVLSDFLGFLGRLWKASEARELRPLDPR